MDLRRKVIPVIWQDQATATVVTKNGTTWTCTTNSSDRCDNPVQTPLKETPECICLRPCTPLQCPCGSHGYRLFEQFDLMTMQNGLCTLSGSEARNVWSVTSCQKGPTPCAADQRARVSRTPGKESVCFGLSVHCCRKLVAPSTDKPATSTGRMRVPQWNTFPILPSSNRPRHDPLVVPKREKATTRPW